MRVPLIATREMTYATRRLVAGDNFEANRVDARLLTALGRARLVEETTEEPKPKKAAPKRRKKKDA